MRGEWYNLLGCLLLDQTANLYKYLMLDMTTNQMAYPDQPPNVEYTAFDVFNQVSYFHPYCPITDYDNATQAQTVSCYTETLEYCI